MLKNPFITRLVYFGQRSEDSL